jgi:hypothetical protein
MMRGFFLVFTDELPCPFVLNRLFAQYLSINLSYI